MSNQIRNVRVSPGNRTPAVADRLAELFLGLKPEDMPAVRGVYVFSFSPDVWSLKDPEVGGFLRRLYGQVPHLLYFLADNVEFQALLSLIVAFCPDDIGTDRGALVIPPGDRQCLLTTVAHYLGAAADVAEQAGLPRSSMAGHLSAFPRDTRHRFEAVLTLGGD